MRKKVFVCLLSAALLMSNIDATAYAVEQEQQESQETEYDTLEEAEDAVETESELREEAESETADMAETTEVESETKSEERKTGSAKETQEESTESTQTVSETEKATESETASETESETVSETESEVTETDPQDIQEGEKSGKCGDNLTWTLDDTGKLTISGTGNMYDYDVYDADEEINMAPWGEYLSELVSLDIKEGVTSIGNCAFIHCSGFTGNLVIPESVITIGEGAFYECDLTGNLVIPENVTTIGDYAFFGCNFTGDLIIPNSVTMIGAGAFSNNYGFTGDLVLSENVATISEYAFSFCWFKGNLVIPNGVTTIGKGAFGCCGFTGKLEIPDSVTTIGAHAFDMCHGFTGDLVIPGSVTTIGECAFLDCMYLNGKLVIPDSVTTIGECAFMDCSFGGELVIPKNITTIDKYAFAGCSFTGDLVIPRSVTTIREGAFVGCKLSGRVLIPKSVTMIENDVFSKTLYLRIHGIKGSYAETYAKDNNIPFKEVDESAWESGLPKDEESGKIGKCGDNLIWTLDTNGKLTISGTGDMYDFDNDKAPWREYDSELVSLDIGEGVTNIGKLAFYQCKGFTGNLVIPNSVTSIGKFAFYECDGFTGNLAIPEGVKTISQYAFKGCSGLTGNLVIPDSVTTIGNYAFSGCKGLTGDLVIPGSVTIIGDYAFYGCSGLNGDLVLSKGVITIGNNAFWKCESLTGHLQIADSVTTIGDKAFEDCSGLTGDLIIPDSVTTIGSYAFHGCSGFTGDLILPDSVTTIGSFAFCSCHGLTGKLVISNSMSIIEDWVFSYCPFAGDIVIPRNVTTIDDCAFAYCMRLSGKVYIPKSVTTIGEQMCFLIPNLCIYGIKGSYAETYAKENSIPFKGVDESIWGGPESEDSDGVLPEDMPEGGEAAIPQGIWVAGIDNNGYTYTGSAITPEVRIYDNNKRLKAGIDYTITYKNNTKASDASSASTAPSVVVKTMGNYSGTKTVFFKILPLDLNSADITAEDIVVANNNQVQKKVPTLTFNGKKLANNKDFTVSYPATEAGAYKAVGTYDVFVTAKQGGNFTGSRVVKLTITDSTLIGKVSVKKIADQPYTGEALTPKPQVTLKGKTLAEGTDYLLSYADNTEIGTAKVIIKGMGDYAGTREITFKITGKPIKSAKISIASNITYNGEEQTPKIALTMNGAPLKEGDDYTIKYQSNVNAGTATVTISGIRSYYGTLKKTFKIAAYDLGKDSDKSLTGLGDAISVNYVKGGCTPKVNLQFKGKALVEGEDYTISYKNNKVVTSTQTKKSPTLTIKGKGNYKGSVTKTFTITPKDLNDVTMMVPDIAFVDKAGKYISKPVLTDTDGKKLVAGKDYEKKVEYKRSDGTVLDGQSKAATGTQIIVTVTGKGAYTGTKTGSYLITKSDFRKAKISISQQTYTGKPVVLGEKDITVKIGTTTLKYGTDYEIVSDSYSNNIKKGTASVTVVGKGEYGGMKQAKFKIVVKKF